MTGTVRRGVCAVACALVGVLGAAPFAAAAPAPLEDRTPVVRIGATTFDAADLDRWAGFTVLEDVSAGTRARAERCREDERAGREPSAACARLMRRLRGEVVPYLIQLVAAPVEARRRGIAVPPSSFARRLRRWIGRESRLTGADIRLLARAVEAEEAHIRADVDALPPLGDAALRRLWTRQRDPAFFTPRIRRAEVLELRKGADAAAAVAALRAGETFDAVAARAGAPGADAYRGAALLFTSSAPRSDMSALEQTIFWAPAGEVRNPVREDGRTYVVRVLEVLSERVRRPLPQVREELESIDAIRRGPRATAARQRATARRWRARTTCDRRVATRRACGRVVDRITR